MLYKLARRWWQDRSSVNTKLIAHGFAELPAVVLRPLATEVQNARIAQFDELSTCFRVRGRATALQPILLSGRGRISFGEGVRFGWPQSPGFFDQYAYLEAAYYDSCIEIGDRTTFNNGATLRCEGERIVLGRDCLVGWSVQILDSDFHALDPRQRLTGTPATAPVVIGDNVFVGANTIIMKGVRVGDDTVIGAGSVVTKSLPAGVIAAGNPARVIKALEDAR